MILKDLMNAMEAIAPKELAEEWDNVGLMVGDADAPIETVVVALDADSAAIRFAAQQGAQVIVSHHPLIFTPVRAIKAPSALYSLVASGIACFSAHTNLDAASGGVNDVLANRIGLQNIREAFGGIGRVGELPEALSPQAFVQTVKEALSASVQFKAGNTPVRTVALVGGAGGDFITECEADAYLTGEIKHHEWLEIPASLTVAVAGHYATEVVVVKALADRLQEALPQLRVIAYEGTAPYEVV